jgi:hypothetical protein
MELAQLYLDRGQQEKAFLLWLELYQVQHILSAQLPLYKCYRFGWGTPINVEQAIQMVRPLLAKEIFDKEHMSAAKFIYEINPNDADALNFFREWSSVVVEAAYMHCIVNKNNKKERCILKQLNAKEWRTKMTSEEIQYVDERLKFYAEQTQQDAPKNKRKADNKNRDYQKKRKRKRSKPNPIG